MKHQIDARLCVIASIACVTAAHKTLRRALQQVLEVRGLRQLAAVFVITCTCCGDLAAAAGAPVPVAGQYAPLPLASAAKVRPDPWPDDAAAVPYRKNTAVASILVSSHQFDQLDAMADGYLAKYKSHEFSADQYVAWLASLAPQLAGKSALADLQVWTEQRPQSFAAWYVLGYQLFDIATDERGSAYAENTSRQQFAGMEEYAGRSRAMFLKARTVATTQKFAADSMLIRIAAYVGRPSRGWLAHILDAVGFSNNASQHSRTYCPVTPPKDGIFYEAWDEELSDFCAANAEEPNFLRPFANLVDYGDPRWGGSFDDLEGVLAQIEQSHNTSSALIADMRSYLLYDQAADAVRTNQWQQAIDLYLAAFNAAPSPSTASYLRWAARVAKNNTKNVAEQEKILKMLAAYQPTDFESWFELGIICETRGDMKCYMDDMVRSGNLGSTSAQNNIGYFYMVGQRGLPKDLVQAKAWLTLAANQGYKHSQDKLDALNALSGLPANVPAHK